ncbi:MAG: protein-disulfide reductase DsbD family protein [Niabella sp.]
MKKLVFILFAVLSVISVYAQADPVSWKFSSKKIADKVYEIHMTAIINNGWHVYSQTQPADAIAIPTKFVLNNNPLATLSGKIAEIGKVEKFHDASINISANQYSQKVDFVQKVTLKAAVKTNITGTVTYQTCNDKECLPPKKVTFKVDLG